MADTEITPFIHCTKCNSRLPWTLQFFAKSGTYKGKLYLLRKCRACVKAYDRERWRAQPERRAAHAEAVQRLQTERRDDYRARHKAWRDQNPDKVRALWERNYARNKEKHLAKNAKWREENPDLRRAYRQNRRALEMASGGKISGADLDAIREAQNGVCFYCEAAPIQEFDHFIPLVAGGAHEAANLRGSCLPCNRSKSVKMPWDWKPEKFSAP